MRSNVTAQHRHCVPVSFSPYARIGTLGLALARRKLRSQLVCDSWWPAATSNTCAGMHFQWCSYAAPVAPYARLAHICSLDTLTFALAHICSLGTLTLALVRVRSSWSHLSFKWCSYAAPSKNAIFRGAETHPMLKNTSYSIAVRISKQYPGGREARRQGGREAGSCAPC